MKKAFTLAEVLITLAIIGVVAALTIPSVVANTQQQEFKTGLRKAVSVLNSAITMNMAIDGESPYENKDLFDYLTRHMSIMKSTTSIPWWGQIERGGFSCTDNAAFYTTDGMRFEFHRGGSGSVATTRPSYTYEQHVALCKRTYDRTKAGIPDPSGLGACGGCGSYGLANNTDNTTKPPCLILVDVNGDRKPTPANVNATTSSLGRTNIYKSSSPNGKKLKDIFPIMITDKQAIPYGVAAQKAMYEAQK